MKPLSALTCHACPHYLFVEHGASPISRPHRANYCAHPAYIESFGIEQYTGPTEPGRPVAKEDCLLETDIEPETVLRTALHAPDVWARVRMAGPELSPVSLLNSKRAA